MTNEEKLNKLKEIFDDLDELENRLLKINQQVRRECLEDLELKIELKNDSFISKYLREE
jgi:flagellar motor component MotA